MKTMNSTVKISVKWIIVFPLLVSISCSDFLEKNAVYKTLRRSSYHSGLFPILDIMSDDARKGSNPTDQAATIGPYDSFEHIPGESTLASWWNTLYEGIKWANVVVIYVPKISMNENLKNRYIGEARFLRALYYFDLMRAWGAVPLVIVADPPTRLARSPKADIAALIKDDLLFAIANLPAKNEYATNDKGRATKDAARALMARFALFQKDYLSAEQYSLEVINSGLYNLESQFADANSVTGAGGIESVFEIGALPFEDFFGSDLGGNQYANVQGVRGTPNRGWGFNRPTPSLEAAFESGDPRLELTIIRLGEILDGITIAGDGSTPDQTLDANGNLLERECYNQKVWTPGINVPTQWGHTKRIIRYADVLLMAAEALTQNNKGGQALVYLNKVRQRARQGNAAILPDITITDKTLLLDRIFQERRVELALEGHRFWDLVRSDRAAQVLGSLGFKTGKHELLPVPQSEIDITQGLLGQNDNW
jgi:starch-binding outer membrane protein, SusD/RagB family